MIEPVDFTAVMDGVLAGYSPRPAIESEIEALLQTQKSPCVILLGEPGSGKTALAAHLIRKHRYLHHFLRPGHTEFSLWRDPYAFLISIALQLRGVFGESVFPSAVAIDVTGRIHTVAEGGSFTGIEVKRLVTLPWSEHRLRAKVDVHSADGSITGVRVGELVDECRHVPLLAFREMALNEPLRRIHRADASTRVVLWVDGLDEESLALLDTTDALNYQISNILPLESELKMLGNTCLVISTRPGPHVTRFEKDGAAVVVLESPKFHKDRENVVTVIVEQELEKSSIALQALPAGWTRQRFKEEIVRRAEGNPLFVRQLFRALREAPENAHLLQSGQIKGLRAIQKEILGRILPGRAKPEQEQAHRLLELLSVAFEALTIEQLAKVSRLGPNVVVGDLQRLAPVLETFEGAGRATLYHSSVRDLILSPENRAAPWGVDPRQAHERFGLFFFPSEDGSPLSDDDYCQRHGTGHLARGELSSRARLIRLMGGSWRERLRSQSGSNYAFLEDLERAWHSMTPDLGIAFPERCLIACRLGLMYGYVLDAMRELSAETLELMVRLGQTQLALDSVPAAETGVEASRRWRGILRGLAAQGFREGAVAERVFLQSVRALRDPAQAKDWFFHELADLLHLGVPGVFPASPELLDEAGKAMAGHAPTRDTGRALAELGRLWSAFVPDAADHYFKQALQFLEAPDHVERERLARYWFAFNPVGAQATLGQAPPSRLPNVRDQPDAPSGPTLAGKDLGAAWKVLMEHRGSGLPPVSVSATVAAQLQEDPDLIEAYAEALTHREIRAQIYLEAARHFVDRDLFTAKRYLDAARRAEEFPRSSAFARHFCFALAHHVELDDYARFAAVLEQVGVHRDARAMWRLHMLDRFLAERPAQAQNMFEAELRTWGNAHSNPNYIHELPARIDAWPSTWADRAAAVLDQLSQAQQRRLLGAALARKFRLQHPGMVEPFLRRASEEPPQLGKTELKEWEVLAFAAGQLSSCPEGERFWTQACQSLVNVLVPGSGLYQTHYCLMLLKLACGDPDRAVRALAALPELTERPIGEEFVFPYEGVSEHRCTGMTLCEHTAGIVLALAAVKDLSLLRDGAWQRFGPAAGSFARSRALLESGPGLLPNKLPVCEEAVQLAEQVPSDPLRRLLLANAAQAWLRLGARTKAVTLAQRIALESLVTGDFYLTKSVCGYGSAVGRCLAVLIAAEQWQEALELLWNARAMGAQGYYLVIAALLGNAPPLATLDIRLWESIELDAYQVFSRS